MFILHTCSFASMLPFVHTALHTLVCLRQACSRYTRSSVDDPQKAVSVQRGEMCGCE